MAGDQEALPFRDPDPCERIAFEQGVGVAVLQRHDRKGIRAFRHGVEPGGKALPWLL